MPIQARTSASIFYIGIMVKSPPPRIKIFLTPSALKIGSQESGARGEGFSIHGGEFFSLGLPSFFCLIFIKAAHPSRAHDATMKITLLTPDSCKH
jgi:hypothetical protein